MPDPNTFGGPVMIRRNGDEEWTEIELLPAHLPQQRGIGLADMMWAQRTGRAHRTSGALALHVLELMTGALDCRRDTKAGASISRHDVRARRRRCPAAWPRTRSTTSAEETMETLRYGIVGSGFVGAVPPARARERARRRGRRAHVAHAAA